LENLRQFRSKEQFSTGNFSFILFFLKKFLLFKPAVLKLFGRKSYKCEIILKSTSSKMNMFTFSNNRQ